MEISQLRSFVVVADLGSYVKASDVLSIPQPTLSRQVRALEVELRANLFHRHGRGVRLTDKGKKFVEYARSVLHTVDAAVLAVRGDDAEYTGRLIIGLTPGIGRLLIPGLARLLKARFPRANISLLEGLSGPLYEQALLGQIDFAVVLNPANSPHLKIEPLTTEQLYLAGPDIPGDQARVISLEALAELPLILPHSNQWTRPAVETAAARKGLRPRIELEVDATFSSLELVAEGVGYTIVPGSIRRSKSIPRLSWKRIVDPPLEATVCLITPERRPGTQLTAAAAEIVKELVRSELGTLSVQKGDGADG